ncbi:MAG: hypothetical protein O3B65_00440 [Chloroflexi bacterium]|nr:hypothetical protein [Chloroflexota bacterium]
MAEIVLGLGTSHSPVLSTADHNEWFTYAQGDLHHRELVHPDTGLTVSYEELLELAPAAVRERPLTEEVFKEQYDACQRGIGELTKTLRSVSPDITVIVSDDQDEMFFDDNMPTFAVFWGDKFPVVPFDLDGIKLPPHFAAIAESIKRGYGDEPYDVPVAKELGRHVIDHMIQHDFDVAHSTYTNATAGGKTGRRYPIAGGEYDYVKETSEHKQGLPHGFSFVVQRLFEKRPSAILPIFQNTCYPPNQPTPKRSFQFGQALREAIESWPIDARVAVVASGGLSHFVVDEELDQMLLKALATKDAQALQNLPRQRLFSAASEVQNWVVLGGVLDGLSLNMDLVEYVPMYRTEAGTGGGWAFARWV